MSRDLLDPDGKTRKIISDNVAINVPFKANDVWPNKPLTNAFAWLCLISRFVGLVAASYGLYLVKLQIDEGDLKGALAVTSAGFLTLIAFYFFIHSAIVQIQQIVARKVYGYTGDKLENKRVSILGSAILFTIVISITVYILLTIAN